MVRTRMAALLADGLGATGPGGVGAGPEAHLPSLTRQRRWRRKPYGSDCRSLLGNSATACGDVGRRLGYCVQSSKVAPASGVTPVLREETVTR